MRSGDKEVDMYYYENICKDSGLDLICGVDEAGRGPLAGPVCAAAVILDNDYLIEGLNDSKKISEKKRESLFEDIKKYSLAYAVTFIDNVMIDEINILKATMLAMRKSVDNLKIKPDIVLIDGPSDPYSPYLYESVNSLCIIKGDQLSASIAAASIVAKVSRDRLMKQIDKEYPDYCFSKHKGYGTKLHFEMIEKYGISPIHRKTFLKKYLSRHEQE